MRIAIVGAGNVGPALGKGWTNSGHDDVFGVRDPSSPKHASDRDIYMTIPDAARASE